MLGMAAVDSYVFVTTRTCVYEPVLNARSGTSIIPIVAESSKIRESGGGHVF